MFQLCVTFTWKDAFDKGSLFGGSVKLGKTHSHVPSNAIIKIYILTTVTCICCRLLESKCHQCSFVCVFQLWRVWAMKKHACCLTLGHSPVRSPQSRTWTMTRDWRQLPSSTRWVSVYTWSQQINHYPFLDHLKWKLNKSLLYL